MPFSSEFQGFGGHSLPNMRPASAFPANLTEDVRPHYPGGAMVKYLFEGVDADNFANVFPDPLHCLARLGQAKSLIGGFRCFACGHTGFCAGKQPHSRRCTRCKKVESATAHTLFHACKLELTQAFRIAFDVCIQPEISTAQLSDKNQTRHMTCYRFKQKVLACKRQALEQP